LQKSIIIKAVFINLFDIFLKNIVAKLRIRPDIRYLALTGYPVSGLYRISGIRPLPDIRYPAFGIAGYPEKQYPVHP
jgi:hypothetical protein